MTLAEIALKRPVTTIMLFISCVVFGLLSARLLKLEFFPELDAPFILVQVPYPGATPKEVEREIVRPLEESLATISGIDNMFANADENGATFFLVFDWNRNIKVKLSEVRERVDAARGELPQDIQRILVQKFSTNDEPVLQVRLSSTTGNLLDAYDLLERRIKRPLERIPGVAAVELSGVEPSEVRIDLLPDAAKALDQAIALNPRRVEAYVLRSAVYAACKEYRRGIELMERARRLAPNDEEVLTALGSQYVLASEGAQGAPILALVTKKNPRRYDAQLLLGHYWHDTGKWPDSIGAFEAYFAKRPDALAKETTATGSISRTPTCGTASRRRRCRCSPRRPRPAGPTCARGSAWRGRPRR